MSTASLYTSLSQLRADLAAADPGSVRRTDIGYDVWNGTFYVDDGEIVTAAMSYDDTGEATGLCRHCGYRAEWDGGKRRWAHRGASGVGRWACGPT